MIIEELLAGYPDMRIVNITHSKTLVEQNFKEFIGLSPFAPAGIYSAGLGRRDVRAQVLFCGIQSVASKVAQLGPIDLVLVDEAHGISRNADSQYGQFFADVKELNPYSRTAGTTATDYRMDSGRLTEGDDRLFDDVVYEASLGDLIEQGYLSPLISKGMNTQIDLSGVGKRGGEYISGQLEKAADRDEITSGAVAEAIRFGHDRRAWLFFCSGQDHSDHVRDELRRQGITAESITSRTPAGEQRRILEDFRSGRVRALASANMLTTGFNVPHVDLISMLRPTASTGLYVQICGRGTRNAPGKTNCLVLDHSGNVRRHGPVDMVQPRMPGKGEGEAPVKLCPQCSSLIHISKMVCEDCGFEFPPNEEEKITAQAEDVPILSKGDASWRTVTGRSFKFHEGKGEKPPSVRVDYMCGLTSMREWLCPQHTGFPKSKADRWWVAHNGSRPFPKAVIEWLERQNELRETAEISVRPSGKYWDVCGYKAADNDNVPPADNTNVEPDWMREIGDEVPF